MNVPPHDRDLEEIVLGTVTLQQDAYGKVSDVLEKDSFYYVKNQKVWEYIEGLVRKGYPIDLATIADQARKTDGDKAMKETADYLIGCQNRVASDANLEFHASILNELRDKRRLIRLGQELTKNAFDNEKETKEIIADLQEHLIQMTKVSKVGGVHITDAIKEVMDVIDRNVRGEDSLTGLPTGFTEFDRFSSGIQSTDLIIVAGETSQGKTALGTCIADNMATMFGKKIVIFNYEMANRQIAARMIANHVGIDSKALLNRKMTEEELDKINTKINKLARSNIWIDPCSDSSLEYLTNSIRAYKAREDIDLVVTDYIQLISNNQAKRNEEVGHTANTLKQLTRSLDVPVIALSQLARDRVNPKPTKSRLKESGDIENAADIVWLLWNPADYDTGYESDDISDWTGLSQHIIAKGRNIGTTTFALKFDRSLNRFSDYDPDEVITTTEEDDTYF